MAKLSSWTQRTIAARVVVDETEINLQVRPNKQTPEAELRLLEAQGTADLGPLFDHFCELVAEWDITDDDGNVLPIGHETLAIFPSRLLMEIIRQVQVRIAEAGK